MRALRVTSLSALSVAALAAGCSLVNSLDDVKPADDGTFTGVPRPDAAAATIEDSGPPPSTADASDGATNPSGMAFAALVVAGEAEVGDAGNLAPVLTVLDSKSGREVSKRETLWIAAVGYDSPRDLWYLFEAPKYFIAGPTETVKLHVRKLDNTTGTWTERATLDVPPLVSYDSVAITNNRISFVAHPAAGTTQFRLVTIDTTNEAAPSKLEPDIKLAALPRGIVATRSSAGSGGYVNLYNTGVNPPAVDAGTDDAAAPTPECVGTGGNAVCVVRVQQYLVPNGNAVPVEQTSNSHVFGHMAGTGQPGYASMICGGGPDDVTVLPLANGTHDIFTRPYLQGSTSSTAVRSFTMSTLVSAPTLLRRAAVDDSRRIVFVVEANSDTNLFAVSMNPVVAPVSQPLRHSGQSVYYDPASETVFAPFNQGEGFTFSPFRVRGTSAAPTLQERTPATADAPWTPPSDLRPLILGIKQPPPGSENCNQ